MKQLPFTEIKYEYLQGLQRKCTVALCHWAKHDIFSNLNKSILNLSMWVRVQVNLWQGTPNLLFSTENKKGIVPQSIVAPKRHFSLCCRLWFNWTRSVI